MGNKIYPAIIIPSKNPLYRGNPLIESIFDLMSPEEFYKIILQKGPLSREEVMMYERNTREQLLDQIKTNLLVPNRRLYDTYKLVHSSINKSYSQRNPLEKPISETLQKDYRNLLQQFDYNYKSSSSNSSMIVGPSGIGKTTNVNTSTSFFHPALEHINSGTEYFIQISYVKIECPKDGSIKDLCAYFFIELDRILGRKKYETEYVKRRDTANDRVLAMGKLVDIHAIGILIIDEIQHLSKIKSGGAKEMLDFFLNLDNTLHIPIVIVGTPETTELFSRNQRLRRRFTSGGAFKWDLLPNDAEWILIIKELFKYQYTDEKAKEDVNWRDLFYYYSQGVIDRAVKIFIEAQKYAFLTNQKAITAEMLEIVVERELWIDKSIFEDIAKGKIDIARSEDLFIEPSKTNKPNNYRLINIQKSLEEFNVPAEFASALIDDYIRINPTESNESIILKILTEFNNYKKEKPSKKKEKLEAKIVENDLRNCEVSDSEILHRQLKDIGVIEDLTEFLI